MPLFHATYSPLSPGQEIGPKAVRSYYPEVLDILEPERPPHSLSHLRCVFATDSVVAATTFLNSEHRDCVGPIRVFEVAMPLYHKAPFRLIHEIGERIKAGQPVESLVSEYWMPRHEWVFWEFFGPAFQVMQEVHAATVLEMTVFQLSYGKDLALSKSL